jgi:hypothetical protein
MKLALSCLLITLTACGSSPDNHHAYPLDDAAIDNARAEPDAARARVDVVDAGHEEDGFSAPPFDAAGPAVRDAVSAPEASDASPPTDSGPAPDAAAACVPSPPPDDAVITCQLVGDGCGGWFPYDNATTNRHIRLTATPSSPSCPVLASVSPNAGGCSLPFGCTYVTGTYTPALYCCPGHVSPGY